MTNGIARSGDVELAYSVAGEGEPAVLLIMGLGGRAADWGSRFPDRLAGRHRVVRFDNRGTGASSKPREQWSLGDMARDAVAVLDAIGVERAHVVGLSMGGMIAQLLAVDHGERVERLVLMGTHFGGQDVVPPTISDLGAIFAPPLGTPIDEVARSAMQLIAAPGFAAADPDSIEALVRFAVAQPTPRRAFMAQVQAILASDRSARVRDIRVPTLVVHGELDPLIPYPNGVALSERIPDSRLVTLRGCGHLPMWEAPDELAHAVLEFFG